MKHVILSSDSNLEYAALLPLTAALWNKIGFRAQVIFVEGDHLKSRPFEVITDALSFGGATVKTIPSFEGVPSSAVAQLIRLLPHQILHINSDLAITSDADMWPVNQAFFEIERQFKIWKHHTNPKAFMCYCAGSASQWADLMHDVLCIDHLVADLITQSNGKVVPAHAWNYDEQLLNQQINDWWCKDACEINERPMLNGLPVGRLDRSNWKWNDINEDVLGLIDAHLPRSPRGLDPELWAKIFPLFAYLYPERAAWAQDYYQQFLKIS